MFKSHPLAATIALLIGLIFLPTSVFAQEDQRLDLTVNPPVIELSSVPGSTITDRFRLRNNTASSLKINITLYKLAPGTLNQVTPQPLTENDEIASWVTINPTQVEAKPGEWTDINYSISIPDSGAFGHYFAFRLTPDQQIIEEVQGTKLQAEIIIPTLLTIKKDGLKAAATLLSFKVPLINEYLPVNFIANIENQGNVHVKPRGNIFIRSSHNQDVAILEINRDLGSVLPGTNRNFDANWDDGFFVRTIQEDGKTKLSINWDKLSKFRLGKYTADLLMVYDNGTRDVPLTQTISFWVIPYKLLIFIFVSVVGIILLIQLLVKIYIRNELAKSKR